MTYEQLSMFEVLPEEKPVVPIISEKRPCYVELTIHEQINLKYNHGFELVWMRRKLRQKRGYDMWPLDQHDFKQIAGIGGKVKRDFKDQNYSVSTQMWLTWGWIHKSSSLFAQYGKEVTWDMIMANSAKKRSEKEKKQKTLKI